MNWKTKYCVPTPRHPTKKICKSDQHLIYLDHVSMKKCLQVPKAEEKVKDNAKSFWYKTPLFEKSYFSKESAQ